MRKYAIYVLGAALGLAIGIPASCMARRAPQKKPVVVEPVPAPFVSSAPSAAPSPSAALATETPIDLRAVLEVLDVVPAAASYGHLAGAAVDTYDGCASITARIPVQSWNLPYPYRLTVTGTGVDVDCGFFAAVHEGGWRTAFCLNETKSARDPQKLFLLADEGGALGIVLGDTQLGSFVRGTCP